jgi:Tol biopolymer transport system component
MRADGSHPRRITSGGRSFHPVWAPRGGRIFFARGPRGFCSSGTSSIWSMRPDGSDQSRVTDVVAGRSEIPGSFSPGGGTLAFTRVTMEPLGEQGRVQNGREVWAMAPDGSGARRLAERAADPAFAPDGRRIAFASDRDENGELSYGDRTFSANELYVMTADGSSPRRLTRTRGLDEARPSWLPSGERIAYERGRVTGNARGVVVMEANGDGSCSRPIIRDRRLHTWHAAPAWRPGDARRGDGPLTC